MRVFRRYNVAAELAQDLVVQGAVNVKVVLVHDIVATVHGNMERVVVDAGSVRVHGEAAGEVVEVALVHLDSLARLGLHGSVLEHGVPRGTAVLLGTLDPFQELVGIIGGQSDIVCSGGTGYVLVDGNRAVGRNHLRDGNPASPGPGAVYRLLGPEERPVDAVHFETVRLGLVADDDGAAVIVQDDLLRVAGPVVVGIRGRRVVGCRKENLQPAARVVSAVLCLELCF